MNFDITHYLPTKFGNLELKIIGNQLYSLHVTNAVAFAKAEVDSANEILFQLNRYFSAPIDFHSISCLPEGSAFQKSVWNELRLIPLGETRTYGDIAKKINSSPRAVGNACRKNPIQIIIPCHRVVSAKGLGGYAGETKGQQLDIKRGLLEHEGVLL